MLATKPDVLNMQIWYVREILWLKTNQYDLSSSISICPMIANFIGYLIAQKELYNCTLSCTPRPKDCTFYAQDYYFIYKNLSVVVQG